MKLLIAFSLLLFSSCDYSSKSRNVSSSESEIPVRGYSFESDPGATKDSKWPDLFAETPNYRAFGEAIIEGNREKFRWNFGPMWYRGRLGKDQVKVFIIGQEGAQDENVSNRSFTGSTGTRMQKFLNYLGIYDSYLYMNTFVYTITGQYSLFGKDRENEQKVEAQKRLLWLAQDSDSIVVKHRHEMFDYVLEHNKDTLALVIGVGTAGKDSAATWVRHHGGKCSSSTLSRSFCQGEGALSNVIVIGVRHPGAASARNAGSSAKNGLRADFQNKANIVSEKIKKRSTWMKPDPGMKQDFTEEFQYGYAPIPHKDFPFGTNWRMGSWATTSNRRSSHAIQVFSKEGCYNNKQRIDGRCDEKKSQKIYYDDPQDLLGAKPVEMEEGDVPYESPKGTLRRNYDEGPGKFASTLMKLWNHDYMSMGVTQHSSFGPNGFYRGKLDEARVLILADQMSHDDMFSGRALTGTGGQRLQRFLQAAGSEKYAILRTLPVDTLDLPVSTVKEIALNSDVMRSRQEIIDTIIREGQTKVILTIGEVAQAVSEKLSLGEVPVIHLKTALATHKEDWNKALAKLNKFAAEIESKEGDWNYDGKLAIIPRDDLPAYTRWWMGTSGSRAARAYEKVDDTKVYNGNYYKVYAPKWATRWDAKVEDLNEVEQKSVEAFKQNYLGTKN